MSGADLNYKTLFELISQSIIVADTDFNVLFANKSTTELLDTSIQSLQKKTLKDFFQLPVEKLPRIKELPLNRETECMTCFFVHENDELTPITLSFKGVPLPVKERMGYYIELQAAEQIQMSEDQIKKIGYTTGKIAHDISNPLAVLKIQCDNLNIVAEKSKHLSSEDIIKRLGTLSKATDRLNISNTELKNLAKSLSDAKMDDINTIISNDDEPKKGFH